MLQREMIRKVVSYILLRWLTAKGHVAFAGNGKRHALLMYTLIPPRPFQWPFLFRKLHNRYYATKLMVDVLTELGYNVHLHDYLDTNVNTSLRYDLFIGHNKYFSRIAADLPSGCVKILLTTGCSPDYDNSALEQRNTWLKNELNTSDDFYPGPAESEYARSNCEVADHIYMIGSEFIRRTGWYSAAQGKASLYNNVSMFPVTERTGSVPGFIYMSSQGQLRRGLDLALLAFRGRSETLYLCGPYERESVFIKHFGSDINNVNVVSMGFVDPQSEKFLELTKKADFALLPSCSEGQSGSLLTLMLHGLIPVATENCGFDNLEEIGVTIRGFTIEDVRDAVDRALALSPEEKQLKRTRLQRYLSRFTATAFTDNFRNFIRMINP